MQRKHDLRSRSERPEVALHRFEQALLLNAAGFVIFEMLRIPPPNVRNVRWAQLRSVAEGVRRKKVAAVNRLHLSFGNSRLEKGLMKQTRIHGNRAGRISRNRASDELPIFSVVLELVMGPKIDIRYT